MKRLHELCAFFGLAIAMLSACNFDKAEHRQFCRGDEQCGSGERCVRSFCVRAEGGSADGGSGREPCDEGTPTDPCYDGASGTRDVGSCRGGERACVGGFYTQCLGQVLPTDDTCNGTDDDCDGTIDEIDTSCPQGGTGLSGICSEGELVCHGSISLCAPVNEAQNEVCNGQDDDCDRETDEITPIECFPSGESGCMAISNGTFTCKGLCRTGMSACSDGEARCQNAVVAAAEDACTAGTGTAADEDCDDAIDEGCACDSGDTRPCYGGPVGSDEHPPCTQGVQTCIAERWGVCEGQVLPQAESCQNQGSDDDCNGRVDDLPGLGEPCIDDSQQGICREGTTQCTQDAVLPTCVGQPPQTELCDDIDQNCNGDPYDGHDLNSDENCGGCGNSCENDTHCCNLECRSAEEFRHDSNNCGECGRGCGTGYYCCWNDCIAIGEGARVTTGEPLPTGSDLCGCEQDCGDRWCCGSECVDLMNDEKNCGACGTECAGGTTCCDGACRALCVGGL